VAEDYETELGNIIPNGALVVRNPAVGTYFEIDGITPYIPPATADSRIPPDGTIVAIPAVQDGALLEGEIDPITGDLEFEPVVELGIPINEEDFFRTDETGLPGRLRGMPIGREAAQILGKALFWDMQVGSDGVQACASCHFHAGVDNRNKNQRNPNTTGPDGNLATLEALAESNTTDFNSEVLPGDFPFHNAP